MPTFPAKFASSAPSRPHLTAPVGQGGVNTPHDTALVQAMLKGLNQNRFDPGRIDGKVGPKTLGAMRAFLAEGAPTHNNTTPARLSVNGEGLRKLARQYNKHVVVTQGTAAPYLAPRVSESELSQRISKLDWAEPLFRKDLADFATDVLRAAHISLTFRPEAGTQRPNCETSAEPVIANLIWIQPSGQEAQFLDGNFGSFPTATSIVREIQKFAQQFELSFKVERSHRALILRQSSFRWQERVRKSPLLESVWVDNPVDKNELILIDPKTGRPRTLTQNKGPMRLRKGLALSGFRTDPPCGLPKPVEYRGSVNPVLVEFPDPDLRQLPVFVNGQTLVVQSPGSLLITRRQAEIIGVLDENKKDLSEHFVPPSDIETFGKKVKRALAWPLVERFADAVIGFENMTNLGIDLALSNLKSKVEILIKRTAKKTDIEPRRILQTDVAGLQILTSQGFEQLGNFLEFIRAYGIPAERVFIGTPVDGVLPVKIIQKGESTLSHVALTAAPLLNGEQVDLEFRQLTKTNSLSIWAREWKARHKPRFDEENDPLLEGIQIAAAYLLDSLGGVLNIPFLILGAHADANNIIEALIDIFSKLSIGKLAKAIVKRFFPDKILSDALKQIGMAANRIKELLDSIKVFFELEIKEFLKQLFDVIKGFIVGPNRAPTN